MNALEIIVVCAVVLLAGTTGVRVAWYEVRQARHARHVLDTSGQSPDNQPDNFYGSMQLDPALERHHVSGQNWREATMVELSPEALDPGPGDDPPLAAPGPVFHDITEEDCEAAKAQAIERWGQVSPSLQHVLDMGGRFGPASIEPVLLELPAEPAQERLADTGDIRDAALLADTTTYMRDQDADVADWMARRAAEWARLEIGVLA